MTEKTPFIAKVGYVNTSAKKCTLVMPGTTMATKKQFKYNASMSISAGQHVLVVPVSGTYVIVCGIAN